MFDKKVDHIGVVVKDLDAAIKHYQAAFGATVVCQEEYKPSNIMLAFIKFGNTCVELIAPLSNDSKASKFLNEHGPGLHHICYEVENIRNEMQKLKALNYELIDLEPRAGARESIIAFIKPDKSDGVLIELCEYPK